MILKKKKKKQKAKLSSLRVLLTYAIFYFAEPMGSVAPKISVENRLKNAEAPQKNTASLFCPGQAYPVPRFG